MTGWDDLGAALRSHESHILIMSEKCSSSFGDSKGWILVTIFHQESFCQQKAYHLLQFIVGEIVHDVKHRQSVVPEIADSFGSGSSQDFGDMIHTEPLSRAYHG